MKDIINLSSRSLALSLLVFLFSLFILSCTGFIFHLSINVYYLPLSLIISLISLYYLLRGKCSIKTIIINFLLFLSVLVISLTLALNFYDFSYDGRTYHQAGIILLSLGWNPVRDNFLEFTQTLYPTKLYHLLWIENYTKFAEIIQANILVVFKHIEAAKMTHFTGAAMLFAYAFYVFGKTTFCKNIFSRFVLSLMLVLNPVFIAQTLTFYIDLYTYIFFMLILLSIIDLETEVNDNIPFLFIIISSVCLLNIKFWGYIYLCTAFAVYLIYLLINKEVLKIKKLVISSMIIIVLVIISGLNPYLTNLRQGRNIIYPVLGSSEAKWVMDINIPKSFQGKNYLELFFLSTFSKTDNFRMMDNKTHQLKAPFSTDKNELEYLSGFDTRIGGFGIFWSGILLIAFLLAIFINYKERKVYSLVFFILLSNLLFQPFCWWARYIPQLWAFPVFVALYFLSEGNVSITKKLAGSFILLAMFLNVSIQSCYVLEHEKSYKKILNYVIPEMIKQNKTVQIYTVFDWSITEKLRENGIKTEFVSEDYFEKNKDKFELVIPQVEPVMYWKLKAENDV